MRPPSLLSRSWSIGWQYADVWLFVLGALLKGYYLARTLGVSSRTAHLSSLLLLAVIASAALLLPARARRWALALAAAGLGGLLFGDVLHHRVFGEMLGAHQLAYAFQLAEVRGATLSLPRWSDIVFCLDAPLWIALWWRGVGRERTLGGRPWVKVLVFTVCVMAYAVNVAAFLRSPAARYTYSEARRGSGYLPVVKRGIYNYHVFDTALFLRDRFSRSKSSASEIEEVEHWFKSRKEEGREVLPFGVARGKNLINIQLESVEDFVIGLEVNGQPITPHLTRLAAESHHFTRFFSQAGEGRSSDGEFTVMNSLLPAPQGAVVQRYQSNSFHALPGILRRHGYHTLVAHTLEAGFWNMRLMHPRYGFEKGYYKDELLAPEEDPWTVPDHRFFDLALPLLAHAPRPFFAHLMTLTSHEPFRQTPPNHRTLKLGPLRGSRIGHYLESIHYVDWAVGRFLEGLKAAGLYDESVIVIYGDHDGLPFEEVSRIGGYEGRHIDSHLRGRVPLLVVIPGARATETTRDPAGHIDVAPTVLHLLGIAEPGAVFLGRNLFRQTARPMAYLRHGEFLTPEHLFTSRDGTLASGRCWSAHDGGPIDLSACADSHREAQHRIQMSHRILNNDLVPRIRRALEAGR